MPAARARAARSRTVGDSQTYPEESKETALPVIQVTFATDNSRHYPGRDAECTAKQSTNPYQCNGPARALLEFIGEITMAIIGDNGNNVLDGGNGKDLIRGGDPRMSRRMLQI
jgi:hypothetical protein